MFVRNVGHLMTNDAILTADGEEIPEGIMDAMFTACARVHDIKGTGRQAQLALGQYLYRETQDARPR